MKKSTIETKYDKYGNKISIFESFKEVDKEKTIKEHITSLSKDNKNPLQDDNVEGIDDINYLLLIEPGVTKKGQLKDDNVHLLNDMRDNFQGRRLENVIDDEKKKN